MKTKLQILIAAVSIAFPAAMALAQAPINPATGLPVNVAQPAIDPTTGLPVKAVATDPATGLPADGSPPFNGASGAPNWIDMSWKDPDKVLSDVDFAQLPLSEVAKQIRQRFTNAFDIIIPASGPTTDPTVYSVTLQLKNVRASEIFSAMNLEFELEKSPLRWELTLNGSRPTALLRYLPQLAPPPPSQTRKVFYVGDIIGGTGTNNEAELNDLAGLIDHACEATGMQRAKVDIFPSGQLLIVSGTPDQVELVGQTLRALKEKADDEKSREQPSKTRY